MLIMQNQPTSMHLLGDNVGSPEKDLFDEDSALQRASLFISQVHSYIQNTHNLQG